MMCDVRPDGVFDTLSLARVWHEMMQSFEWPYRLVFQALFGFYEYLTEVQISILNSNKRRYIVYERRYIQQRL